MHKNPKKNLVLPNPKNSNITIFMQQTEIKQLWPSSILKLQIAISDLQTRGTTEMKCTPGA
jgi:hypothetical protein